MSLGYISLLHTFKEQYDLVLPIYLSYLVLGSWSHDLIQVQVASCEVIVKSNQISLAYSHQIGVTIVITYLPGRTPL